MPSNTYFAEIHPEPKWRVIVLLSGFVAGLTGLLLALFLPLGVLPRALLAAGWLLLCGRDITHTWRGYALGGALRIRQDARVEVRMADGEWQAASLLPGSVVLPGAAWLRLCVGAAPAYGELLTGNPRENNDWRRLLVIWRHIGAGI